MAVNSGFKDRNDFLGIDFYEQKKIVDLP